MNKHKQLYHNDCGISSIKFILNEYLKIKAFRHEIINDIELTDKGINVYSLVQYLKKYQADTQAYKANKIEALRFTPSILLLQKNEFENGHFVVLTKINKNSLIIYDPNVGYLRVSKKNLLKNWKGVFVDFNKSLSINKTNNCIQHLKLNKIPLILLELIELFIFIYILSNLINVISSFTLGKLATLILSVILYLIITNLKIRCFNNLLTRIDSYLNKNVYKSLFKLPKSYVESMSTAQYQSLFSDSFRYRTILLNSKNPFILVLLTILVHTIFSSFYLFWGLLLLSSNLVTLILTLLVNFSLKEKQTTLTKTQNNIQDLIQNISFHKNKDNSNYCKDFMDELHQLHKIEEKVRSKNTFLEGINKLTSLIFYIIIIVYANQSDILY